MGRWVSEGFVEFTSVRYENSVVREVLRTVVLKKALLSICIVYNNVAV